MLRAGKKAGLPEGTRRAQHNNQRLMLHASRDISLWLNFLIVNYGQQRDQILKSVHRAVTMVG